VLRRQGCSPGRQEGVEHQAAPAGEALGGEFEHGAQLLGRPEIVHHLRGHGQLVIRAQFVGAREDVALDDANVE